MSTRPSCTPPAQASGTEALRTGNAFCTRFPYRPFFSRQAAISRPATIPPRPYRASISVTLACGQSAFRSRSACPFPPPPCVIKGAIVLPRRLVFLQKRCDRRRDGAPPVRRAKIDYVVIGQSMGQLCNRRPVARADLPLCLLRQRVVFGHIRRLRTYFLHIRARPAPESYPPPPWCWTRRKSRVRCFCSPCRFLPVYCPARAEAVWLRPGPFIL